MSTKQTKTTTKTEVETKKTVKAAAVAAPQPVVEAPKAEPVAAPVKAKASKKAAEPVVAPAPVVEATPAPVVEAAAPEAAKKQRKTVSSEAVEISFTELQEKLEKETEALKEADGKNKALKLLRTVAKELKQLHVEFAKLQSKKSRKKAATGDATQNLNSGFMKKVKVVPAMAKFAGVANDQLLSRVDVTKSICQYIKEHNLQTKDDKRKFVPDDSLAKLLGSKEPCTYYNLQKSIQPLFQKAA